MLKKAAALLFVCASMATWVGCGSTSSHYLYATIPLSNQIVAYREDPNSGVLTQLTGSPITAGTAVQSIAMHPSGKFLYAANSGDGPPTGDVSLFTISTTGAIAEVTPRTNVGLSPTLLSMDSAGAFLYVGNAGSGSISAFSIDSGTGALTEVAGSPFPIGRAPLNMKVAPSGSTLYVTLSGDLTGIIEAFNLNQGVLSPAGSPSLTGRNPFGLTISSSGKILYTANTLDNSISEFMINADGSLSELSGSPIGEQYAAPVTLFIDKSGAYLYVANNGSSNLAAYSIGSDGSLALLTGSPFGTGSQPNSLATDSGGKYLFVGNQQSPVIQSFSLDTGTGALTSVATYPVPGSPTSIALTP
jgi:6-phosphogluconolactonase (cycloisomerase 2 family)